MEDKNLSDLGRQMNDAVQNALRSGDFSQLKHTVTDTVNTVVEKTVSYKHRKSFQDALRDLEKKIYQSPPPDHPPHWESADVPNGQGAQPVKDAKWRAMPWNAGVQNPYLKKSAGNMVAGIATMVIGYLGAIPMAIATLIIWASVLFDTLILNNALLSSLVLVPMTGLFSFLVFKGSFFYKSAKRYRLYWRLLEQKKFYELEKLASAVNKTLPFVKKEVVQLYHSGMFPNGYMDHEKTCIMLGEDIYRQYLEVQEAKRHQEQEEIKIKEDTTGLAGVIAEGKECIRQIRKANQLLPGAEISAKLDRLELVTTKIFSYVEQRPNKLPEIRRFMAYYLPTTIKLVHSYQEFDGQSIQGETIVKAKAEILDILDTINTAFETLLDGLFHEDAMDISTDISALKTMLAQEGLGQRDFKTDEPPLQ